MLSDGAGDDPITLAESAHALVESDVTRAAEIAERALRLARRNGDREAEVAALHALGFARHELGDARAVRTLRAAVRIGDRHGLSRRAALARRPLAIYLAYRGEIDAALRELDAACAALHGLELARSEVSRIAVLGLGGRTPEWASSERARRVLSRHGDTIWEARLLWNRGFLLAERGDVSAAEPDLTRARELYRRAGATSAAQGADYELARIALARGDLPACLARLDAIDTAGVPPLHRSALELLRSKALVAARLTTEARRALDLAQQTWRRAGIEDPEGRLEIVRLTLLAGDAPAALQLARQAQRSFAARGRGVYGARAAGLVLAAALQAGAVRPPALRSGRRAAVVLEDAGSRDEARHIRLLVARAAIVLGRPVAARGELAASADRRREVPVGDRIEAAHVEALLALHSGDGDGARRAARRGLDLLDAYRAALGAADLRATASEIGVELAALGLRSVLAEDDIEGVLRWIEALRASALRLAPVTPPDRPELRAQTTDLRRVNAEIRRAERGGHPARALVDRQAALEESIRRLSRHVGGERLPPPSDEDAAGRAQLARALGRGALVEMFELDGELTALTLVDGRLARHSLGPVQPVREQLEWLRFALARLAGGRRTAAQRAATLAGARASARALDAQLIAPLAERLGDRALVIVPPSDLHTLPWSTLPSLRGRPVAVCPSAGLWLARRRMRAPRSGRVVLVAGPRLRHAGAEVAGLRASYPQATALVGRDATAAAVMRAIDGAAVAHLACHGQFRADSPLFSALELADGPLNAYELQRLRRPPRLVVLSACELAVADARPGDELLGVTSVLLGLGARTVIASVVPVRDAASKRSMIALHENLAAGEPPAIALAHAQVRRSGPASALAGYVCLGAG